MKYASKWDTYAIVLVVATFAVGVAGAGWGLPSSRRAEITLSENLRTPAFYARLAKVRADIYEKAGPNLPAYAGRLLVSGGGYDASVNLATPPEKDGTIHLVSKGRDISLELLRAYNSYLLRSGHPDEQDMLTAISKMNPRRLKFDPHFYRYGGSYLYPLAGWFGAAGAAGYLKINPDITFYHASPGDMGRFYLLGRLFSLVFGAMLVWTAYLFARDFYGPRVGFFAALIFASSPMLLAESNTMKPHIYAAFWAMLGVYWMQKLLRSDDKKYYWAAGAALGLAAGTTINSWIYLAFLPAVILAKYRARGAAFVAAEAVKRSAQVLAVSAVVFTLTNPYVIFSFADYMDELRWTASFHHFIFRPWVLFTVPFRAAFGAPLAAAVLAALLFALVHKKETGDRLLSYFSAAALLFLAVSSGGQGEASAYMRYHLPLMAVLSAVAASAFSDTPRIRPVVVRAAALAVIGAGVLWAQSLRTFHAVKYIRASGDGASAIAAGRWINTHVPPGSSVGVMKYTPHVDSTPPFRFADYKIISGFERVESIKSVRVLPEYFIMGEPPDFLEIKWKDFYEFYDETARFGVSGKIGPFVFVDKITPADFSVAVYKLTAKSSRGK